MLGHQALEPTVEHLAPQLLAGPATEIPIITAVTNEI